MQPLWKRFLYRIHWFFGLFGAVVLAVVGATGAMLSFEREILNAVNDQLFIEPRGAMLSPDEIVARTKAAYPEFPVQGYTWYGPARAVEMRLQKPGAQPGPGSGIVVAVNPYTGEMLGEPKGDAFFHSVEALHRNLAAGPVGKQIVGASTIGVVLLVLTGIWLRWPRKHSLKAWLAMPRGLKGRPFLWQLHAVVGTWCALFFLVAALTGLQWSYEWYRAGLQRMAGVPVQQGGPRGPGGAPGAPMPPTPSLDASFARLQSIAPDATRMMVFMPRAAGAPIEWRFLTPKSAHDRAFDLLKVDAATGEQIALEPYAEQPRGRRFMASIFPLHTGMYFGRFGQVGMMLASAMMPLFAITGWLLWLKRRSLRAARASASPAPARRHPTAPSGEVPESA